MSAGELLEDHGLANAAVTIEQRTGHAGTGRMPKQPFEVLQEEIRARVTDPVRGMDLPDAVLSGAKCLRSYRHGKMGQIVGHLTFSQVSTGKVAGSCSQLTLPSPAGDDSEGGAASIGNRIRRLFRSRPGRT